MDNSAEIELAESAAEPDNHSIASILLQSAVDSAFFQPTKALAQITDKICGTRLEDKVSIFSELGGNEEFGSANWHARTIGNAIGTLLPLMLTSAGVKRIAGSAAMERLTVRGLKSSQSLFGLRLSEAAAVGFLNDAVLKPTKPTEHDTSFLTQRLTSGAEGAFNFTLMTGTSVAMEKAASANFAERWGLARGLRQPVINTVASSTPAAVLGAQLHASQTRGDIASASDFCKALYSNAVAGAAFGTKHMLQSRLAKAKTVLADHTEKAHNSSQPIEQNQLKTTLRTTSDKTVLDEVTIDEAKEFLSTRRAAKLKINGVPDSVALEALSQLQKSMTNRGPIAKILVEMLNNGRGDVQNEDTWNSMQLRATLATKAVQTIEAPPASSIGAPIDLEQANALIYLDSPPTSKLYFQATELLKSRGLKAKAIELISPASEEHPSDLTEAQLNSILHADTLISSLSANIENTDALRIVDDGAFKTSEEILAFASLINRNSYASVKLTALSRTLVSSIAELSRGKDSSDSALEALLEADPQAQTFLHALRLSKREINTDQSSKPDTVTLEEARALEVLWKTSSADGTKFASVLSSRGLASQFLALRHSGYVDATADSFEIQSKEARRFADTYRSLSAEPTPITSAGPDVDATTHSYFEMVPITSTEFEALKVIKKEYWSESDAIKLMAPKGPVTEWMTRSIFKFLGDAPAESAVLTTLHKSYYLKKSFASIGEKSISDKDLFGMASTVDFKDPGEMDDFARFYVRFPKCETVVRDLKTDSRIANQMAKLPLIEDAPREVLLSVYDHLRAVGTDVATNHLDGRDLQACTQIWTLEPSMPPHLAEEVAKFSPLKQIASAVAWIESADSSLTQGIGPEGIVADQPIDNGNSREALYRSLLEKTSARTRTETVAGLHFRGALPRAIEAIHGTLDAETKAALLHGVKRELDPFRILVGIRGANFRDAYSLLKENSSPSTTHWESKAAVALAGIFKGGFQDWLNLQSKFGRDLYAASHWLPAAPKDDLKGLANVLIANAGKQPHDLKRAAECWKTVPENVRASSFHEIDEWVTAGRYVNRESDAFASEAGKWNVTADDYSKYENRFLQSQGTKVPFPTDRTWSAGGLSGRFLRRDDPRGVFLGEHTNCCQHPGGVGATCAWFGQENPRSGFFIIEDAHKQIVAQSWVWLSEKNDVVFDSVESKGIGDKRIEPIRSIYQQSANALATNHNSVALGYTDKTRLLSQWKNTPSIPMPEQYSGYTDDLYFKLLAKPASVAD